MKYEAYRKRSDKGVRKIEPQKDKQKGYQESAQEKQSDLAPKEVTELKTGDGVISLGVNRKKEVTMTLSVDKDGPLREEQKRVDMNHAGTVTNTQGKMFTNKHNPQKSAVAVKVPLDRQTYGLETKLWSTAEKLKGNSVVNEVLPFITKQENKLNLADAVHQNQQKRKVEQEIEQSLEKMKKQAKKAEKYHNSLFLENFLSNEEAEEEEEEEEDSE